MIQLAFSRLPWASCSSWLLLAPPGSFWVLLALPGLLLDPSGSSWILLGPPECSWLFLTPPGSSWLIWVPGSSCFLAQSGGARRSQKEPRGARRSQGGSINVYWRGLCLNSRPWRLGFWLDHRGNADGLFSLEPGEARGSQERILSCT